MYAVIETGGKQYRVASGDVIRVEKLDAAPGSEVAFDRVLLVAGEEGAAPRVGTPHLEGARVTAAVTTHGRAPKLSVLRFRRRQNSKSRIGHRQHWTELEIRAIEG